MIIYTRLVPGSYSGLTAWPVILIHPDHKDDKGLIAHEQVHYAAQAWNTPIWFLRYWLSKSFRLREEAAAYKVSIKYGMTLESAVRWLTTYGATQEEAQNLLTIYQP